MKLGRNICHLSTVMRGADLRIDRLLVSHETLCTLIGSSFRKAGQLLFPGCLVLFYIVLKCFLKVY